MGFGFGADSPRQNKTVLSFGARRRECTYVVAANNNDTEGVD